jgi:exo-beta-1,3-glucanase (GH17 family)
VTYDPVGWNPYFGPEPSPASIRRDLQRIHNTGFTGIVTFSSRGGLARVPRIAKTERLAVIMGVWNPADVGELREAIAQHAFADAYCVGHDGLNKPNGYTIEDLEKAVALLKRRTSLPVTASEEVRLYKDPALLRLGDWLFPDIHVSLLDASGRLQQNPSSNLDTPVDLARKISVISAEVGRPLMLKMVTFPWQGVEGGSIENQSESFDHFLEILRSPEQAFAARPALAFHSAFDLPWKTQYPFYEWDPYTGVLNADGTPRPAARTIVARCQ